MVSKLGLHLGDRQQFRSVRFAPAGRYGIVVHVCDPRQFHPERGLSQSAALGLAKTGLTSPPWWGQAERTRGQDPFRPDANIQFSGTSSANRSIIEG